MQTTAARSTAHPLRLAALPALFVVVVALCCALLLVLQPLDVLVRHLKDDSFYYFKTANNIALGLGSTFDGINPTNGYHPLWMLNVIPVYWLLPQQQLAALRIIVVLAALYHTAAAWVIYRLLARLHGVAVGVLLAVAYASSPFVLRMTLNGMESALYGLALAGFVALVTLRAKDKDGRWDLRDLSPRVALGVGVVLALCVLARLDAIMLVVSIGLCAGLALFVRGLLRQRAVALIALMLPTLLCLALYAAFNMAAFGQIMPISGAIKRPNLAQPLPQLFELLLWPLGPLYRRIGLLPSLGGILAMVAGIALLCARLRGPRALALRALRRYDWLWFGVALIYVYISLSNSYIANWYYVPMFLLATLVCAEATAYVLHHALPLQARAPTLAGVATVTALAYVLLATAEFSPRKNDTLFETLRAAEWVRANLPADSRGAAWNAGVLAYFSGRQVVNLDGLINSYDYYEAMRQGRAAAFVRRQGVRMVFDMFPVPPLGDSTAFVPDAQWAPNLRPRYEYRYYAHNVGLSSFFRTVFPQAEHDSPFMFKVWDVISAED